MRLAHVRGALPALVLALCASARADATTITLYGAARGAGFALAGAAAAVAAGVPAPVDVDWVAGAGAYFSLALREPAAYEPGRSPRRPARGSGAILLRVADDAPAALLDGLALVVLGQDPADPLRYKARRVGLAIAPGSPWRLVTGESGGPVYLAYVLGALAPGASYEVPLEYRVAQRLKRRGGEAVFPRFGVAYASLPEPGAVTLLVAGLACALLARCRVQAPAPRRQKLRSHGAILF